LLGKLVRMWSVGRLKTKWETTVKLNLMKMRYEGMIFIEMGKINVPFCSFGDVWTLLWISELGHICRSPDFVVFALSTAIYIEWWAGGIQNKYFSSSRMSEYIWRIVHCTQNVLPRIWLPTYTAVSTWDNTKVSAWLWKRENWNYRPELN
jgi:hypothetical protein